LRTFVELVPFSMTLVASHGCTLCWGIQENPSPSKR
jgi:hypothetical protein